jgi:uncharacterized repeat protein (TIGR03803 family)
MRARFDARLTYLVAAFAIHCCHAQGAIHSNLHSFQDSPTDGALPYGGLTFADSALYGVTPSGGAGANGILFKINPDGTGYTTLHTFVNNALAPYGSLVQVGSQLFGLTQGAGLGGTIYNINTDGSGFAILHAFQGGSDGRIPEGLVSMKAVGSTLYGMTTYGGYADEGIVFKINTDGSGYTVLHQFARTATEGGHPNGHVTIVGSEIFGETDEGGAYNHGVIFRMNLDGTGYMTLHDFQHAWEIGAGARTSDIGLTEVGSKLYGTTPLGGDFDRGSLFEINDDGTGFSVIHSFSGGFSGEGTQGGVIFDKGYLFGAAGGGPSSAGIVYRIKPDGSDYSVLDSFKGNHPPVVSDGRVPVGDLTLVDSELFGMTWFGGDYNAGTIFSLPEPVESSAAPEPWSIIIWPTLMCLGGMATRRTARGKPPTNADKSTQLC